MLEYLDRYPGLHWWIFSAVFVVIVGVILRSSLANNQESQGRASDWRWGFALAALLLAGRWPDLFVTREFNPDESQLLAGAMTLRHDPVFWRAVDGATAGPFDFFALWPVGSVVGTDNYLSARITALLLIAVTLLMAHQAVAFEFGPFVARLATLVPALFESLTLDPDFRHYSTELVPICMLATAFYLAWKEVRVPDGPRPRLALIGFLLGAVPFSKLQAVPLAAFGGVLFLGYLARSKERPGKDRFLACLWLVAGALSPLAAFSMLLTFFREWENAIIPYLYNNIDYLMADFMPFGKFLVRFHGKLSQPGDLYELYATSVLAGLLLIFALGRRFGIPWNRFGQVSLSFLVVSFACVLAPRRDFPHYFQLSILPLCLVGAASLDYLLRIATKAKWGNPRAPVVAFAFLIPALMVAARAPLSQPYVGRLGSFQASPAGAVAKKIREYSREGDSLCAWGWRNRYYVEAGLRQATRDSHSYSEMLVSRNSGYFRKRYLSDLYKSQPAVFIDTSNSPEYPFPPGELFHEVTFPELGSFVRENYTLVDTVDRIRIYVRKDRLAAIESAGAKAGTGRTKLENPGNILR